VDENNPSPPINPQPPVPSAPVRPGPAGALPRLNRRNKLPAMILFFLVVGGAMWGAVKLYNAVFGDAVEEEGKKQGASGPVAVNVLEVKHAPFQDVMPSLGTIAGGSEIPLRFETEGTIRQFDFRQGDKVRKGETIARLDAKEAYLKYERANKEYENMRQLYAAGGISRMRLEQAEVEAALARTEYEKTILRASRDGILGDKDAEVGEFVTPNKKIATLVSMEKVVVKIGIIEKEVDKVFPGAKVIVTVDAYPGVEFTGRVENMDPVMTQTSRTMSVQARLDNSQGLLLPGMSARAKIIVYEEARAIAVPNDSVEKSQGGARVFVVTKDNKAQARDVTVGYVSNQFSLVTQGLSPGDLVVTQKPHELKDGSPVKIIETQK
jgi:membrane fusion protein, multidrug efflux system